ncbi:MAG: monofunctional biosynthetic peptidoglycan transglycosylase [Burkholderiaceae bacterium]|jgi:monofunctional biosynthetic peptidoglycan transglycosylase|nr:monofunctional biosynthetic peptidoglycan transglycosylase [Burkholderiaceae bacterium]
MRALLRWLLCLLLAGIALELFFVLRITMMVSIDPQSTTFQRSEAWRIVTAGRINGPSPWSQHWVPYAQISGALKRAVIASEDDDFIYHHGVEWDAIEAARKRNERAQALAKRRALWAEAHGRPAPAPKIRGGSTITQQLAKNLLLSGERTLPRKAQELALTVTLELLLDKRRILEIYLNNVEWGEGIYGAEAAARHYYGKSAAQLNAAEAARLAVMLPNPRAFQRRSGSSYLARRSQVIEARMNDVQIP